MNQVSTHLLLEDTYDFAQVPSEDVAFNIRGNTCTTILQSLLEKDAIMDGILYLIDKGMPLPTLHNVQSRAELLSGHRQAQSAVTCSNLSSKELCPEQLSFASRSH